MAGQDYSRIERQVTMPDGSVVIKNDPNVYQDQAAQANNDAVDQAQHMLEAAQNLHEMFGMTTARGSKGIADRLQQLKSLRNFVTLKQPVGGQSPEQGGYNPQYQLQAIDAEIARLQAAMRPRNPIVQSATDNQKGK